MPQGKVGAFHLLYEQFLAGEDVSIPVSGTTFSAACQELGGAFRGLEEDYQRRMALRSIEESMDELDSLSEDVFAEQSDNAREPWSEDDGNDRYSN